MTTTTDNSKIRTFNTTSVFGEEQRTTLSKAITATWELSYSEETKSMYDMLMDLHKGQYNVHLPSLCMDNIKDKELLLDLMHLFVAIKKQVY